MRNCLAMRNPNLHERKVGEGNQFCNVIDKASKGRKLSTSSADLPRVLSGPEFYPCTLRLFPVVSLNSIFMIWGAAGSPEFYRD